MTRDLDAIRSTLVRVLPEGSRITGLTPLATGHSNETYLIAGLDQILRLPPAADALLEGHGVVAQARIYDELAKVPGGPPVPRIRLICEDPGVLGDPFFVMDKVAGDSINDYVLPAWFTGASDAVREGISRQYAAAFGSLARLERLAALSAPVTPEAQAGRWRTMAEEADCPELVALFDQLLAAPAPRSGPFAPVHGDTKLANMMWDQGQLTAVLDWELAYNGDPLTDLGYMLYFFPHPAHAAGRACREGGMWGRDQVIAEWTRTSGRSEAGVAWHEVAAVGKMAAIVGYGYSLFATGKSTDERLLRWRESRDLNVNLMRDMLPLALAAA
jgi:aminoglycoside phosphotransferase (APT) family kinase protein